jgi:hypothetical protein
MGLQADVWVGTACGSSVHRMIFRGGKVAGYVQVLCGHGMGGHLGRCVLFCTHVCRVCRPAVEHWCVKHAACVCGFLVGGVDPRSRQ